MKKKERKEERKKDMIKKERNFLTFLKSWWPLIEVTVNALLRLYFDLLNKNYYDNFFISKCLQRN